MTLSEYATIVGITVATADETRVTAQITKSQRIIESLLGFTLDTALFDSNEYTEVGKTPSDCPCPDVDLATLLDPDAVVGAYRLYPYNSSDKYLLIDPASAIHAVKLVRDGITFKTLETKEFRGHLDRGIIKSLEQYKRWCGCFISTFECECTQLAVDATWLWNTDAIPDDLNQVWVEMITFYADPKNNIKSETLGPHSYTKIKENRPEMLEHNLMILKKYQGAKGTITKIPTQ